MRSRGKQNVLGSCEEEPGTWSRCNLRAPSRRLSLPVSVLKPSHITCPLFDLILLIDLSVYFSIIIPFIYLFFYCVFGLVVCPGCSFEFLRNLILGLTSRRWEGEPRGWAPSMTVNGWSSSTARQGHLSIRHDWWLWLVFSFFGYWFLNEFLLFFLISFLLKFYFACVLFFLNFICTRGIEGGRNWI